VDPHISGKPFEQTQGWNWINTVHPEDQENLREQWQDAIKHHRAFAIDARVWHEEAQKYRWFNHKAVPIIKKGTLIGWVGASIDIQERKEFEDVQRENEIQMATQRRLLETRDNERVKIARDIHDGPIQTLVGTIFDIHNLNEEVVDPTLKAELKPLELSLLTAIQELREVVNELRPPMLDRFGLVKAIQEYSEDILEKCPGLELSLDLAEDADDISEQISLTLYLICREALHNIVRHSKATSTSIHLSLDQDQVDLEIQDNGIGFSMPDSYAKLTEEKHFGLAGMKERTDVIGGTFQVSSQPGLGTKIKVSVPINN
jgi:PAS domain S-box-containing protein